MKRKMRIAAIRIRCGAGSGMMECSKCGKYTWHVNYRCTICGN